MLRTDLYVPAAIFYDSHQCLYSRGGDSINKSCQHSQVFDGKLNASIVYIPCFTFRATFSEKVNQKGQSVKRKKKKKLAEEKYITKKNKSWRLGNKRLPIIWFN